LAECWQVCTRQCRNPYIKKRFGVVFEPYHLTDLFTHVVTDKETTMPVIQHFKKLGKVDEIVSSPAVGDVHAAAVVAVEKALV